MMSQKQDPQPFTSQLLRCFVCGNAIKAIPSKETRDFVQRLAGEEIAFIVCQDCFNQMLAEKDRDKRTEITR